MLESNQFLIQFGQAALTPTAPGQGNGNGQEGGEMNPAGTQGQDLQGAQVTAGGRVDKTPKRQIAQIDVAVEQMDRQQRNQKNFSTK